jgi:diguanylate cyclase (GGDEF)-like protein
LKIGEFAEMNNVTTKMLRHYDEIGLLKPSIIDGATGYRSYDAEQSHYLNWIVILKNLDFSLAQIKTMLSGPVDGRKMIQEMVMKRIEITSALNEKIQRKVEIDNLIRMLEKEGFQLDKQIDLLNIGQESIHEIKKNIPNMETFLETARGLAEACAESGHISVFRFDISHFKQVNDEFGFEVGDKVIVACYNIIKSNIDSCFSHSALGRAHGDEFIAFANAGREETEAVTRAIARDMEEYDWNETGCGRKVSCYIGGLIGGRKDVANIRYMIEQSIETINEARKGGSPNAVAIRFYEA